jgi:parvulin-like peptidyl-prolyl isomerase
MRTFVVGLASLLAAWYPLAAAEYELSNGIAAIADENVITVQDVRQASADTVDLYRRTYGNNREVFEQKRIGALTEALEALIDRQLVLHDFKNLGGIIQESYIDDVIRDRIREQFGDRVTLTKTLQAQGITYETYRQREREKIITSIMERKNVREALLISPSKIERHYQTNLSQFKLGDRVKLRVIVFNRPQAADADEIRKLALAVKSKVDGGAAFAEMASTYSEGPERRQGGAWDWKQDSQLRKGLWEVASSLSTGKCSRVISMSSSPAEGTYWVSQFDDKGEFLSARKFNERDRDGLVEEVTQASELALKAKVPSPQVFYLMLADDKQVARTRALTEVRDEIERELLLQERARLQKKWIERLRTKSFVRYF